MEEKKDQLLNKIINKETSLYIVFGVLTTIVNFGSFVILEYILGDSLYLLANIGSFICATVFAFVTNKKFVFVSTSWKASVLWKEFVTFVLGRIGTFLIIEELGLYLAVELLGMKNMQFAMIDGKFMAKIILAVIGVLANYIFGKFWVFKKN